MIAVAVPMWVMEILLLRFEGAIIVIELFELLKKESWMEMFSCPENGEEGKDWGIYPFELLGGRILELEIEVMIINSPENS
jgi:hypothetical protein